MMSEYKTVYLIVERGLPPNKQTYWRVAGSAVVCRDGSVLAQLGNPDMRTPIAIGLSWPERIDAGVGMIDLFRTGSLHFERPDEQRFPCLRLAAEAFSAGGTAAAVLNAANEEAVAAFLDGRIRFTHIPAIIERTLSLVPSIAVPRSPMELALNPLTDAKPPAK